MSFIDQGTYGCVFSPALKCEDKRQLPDVKTVGKIYSDEDEFDEEKDTNKFITEKLDPNHEWTVPYLGTCKTDVLEADKTEIDKCKHIQDGETIKDQLLLTYGGVSLSKLCDNIDQYPDFTIDELILMFLSLMKGVIILDKEDVCHLDIKPANILYNIEKNKLYLIDFGLLTKQSELFKQGSFLNTDYPYFPPEFKMVYRIIEKNNILKSTNTIINNFKFFDKTKFLEELKPFIHFNEKLQVFLDTYKDDISNLIVNSDKIYISKADVYALGISFFEVYYFLKINNKLRIQNTDFVNECIHEVFSKMINPNADERCSPNEAYKELSKIIKKHKTTDVQLSLSSVKLPNIQSPKKSSSGTSGSSKSSRSSRSSGSSKSVSSTDYSNYTVKQLKTVLKEKGRTVTGNKSELVQRASKAKTPPINLATLTQTECEKLPRSKLVELLQEKKKPVYGNKKTLCERLLQK